MAEREIAVTDLEPGVTTGARREAIHMACRFVQNNGENILLISMDEKSMGSQLTLRWGPDLALHGGNDPGEMSMDSSVPFHEIHVEPGMLGDQEIYASPLFLLTGAKFDKPSARRVGTTRDLRLPFFETVSGPDPTRMWITWPAGGIDASEVEGEYGWDVGVNYVFGDVTSRLAAHSTARFGYGDPPRLAIKIRLVKKSPTR